MGGWDLLEVERTKPFCLLSKLELIIMASKFPNFLSFYIKAKVLS
jgi:hypothetical protein